MMNPTLCDLVGGIQTVTLSDEEARRRGTQKSVLERKAPPTFDVVVEIQGYNTVAVRQDVAEAVDTILRGRTLPAEVRVRQESGDIEKTQEVVQHPLAAELRQEVPPLRMPRRDRLNTLRIFPNGLNQDRIRSAARRLRLPIELTTQLKDADALFTLRTYYRKRPQVISDAERRGCQCSAANPDAKGRYLVEIFGLADVTDDVEAISALDQARDAILRIQAGERTAVQLSSQAAHIRRMQHELARQANLTSRSAGDEPQRHVTIFASR